MSTNLAKIVADFNTTITTKNAVGDTTSSIASVTDDDGVALTNGVYYFTIDGDNAEKEFIQATITGTALASIKTLSRHGTLVSGFARVHRVGATVEITDFGYIKMIMDLLDGTTDLNASVPLKYDGTATISNANMLATKAYADALAIAGSPDSTTTVKGISKMSVAPASAASPIAVGDNDPRVPTVAQVGYIPTSGQKDGLAATTTPASTNLFTTQKDFQKGAELYGADAGGDDTYVIALSPVLAAYTTGQELRFKVATPNTGAATIDFGPGAKTLKKYQGTAKVDLESGDIIANQFITVIYDGTDMVLQSTSAQVEGTFSNGTFSKSLNDADVVQTIAHGLGRVPKRVRITALAVNPSNDAIRTIAMVVFSGSTSSSIEMHSPSIQLASTTFKVHDASNSDGRYQTGTITLDATNINISWVKTGGPTNTAIFLWEAEA